MNILYVQLIHWQRAKALRRAPEGVEIYQS